MNTINKSSAAYFAEDDELPAPESYIADPAIEAWFRHATTLNGFGASEAAVDRVFNPPTTERTCSRRRVRYG